MHSTRSRKKKRPLTRSHRCHVRNVVSTCRQEHSSRLGHPLHRSHHHATRFQSPQTRFRTVLDSLLPFATVHLHALACSRPATTLTRSEFDRLTPPEDHNVPLPAPLRGGPQRFHFVPFRRNERVLCPRIDLQLFIEFASHCRHHQSSQHRDSFKKWHRTEQERCNECSYIFFLVTSLTNHQTTSMVCLSHHRPCSCRSTTV